MSQKQLPAFANEAEEAAWWYDNREEHSVEFAKAFEEGRVRVGGVARRLAAMRGSTIVEIPADDARLAAELAAREGVEVSRYIETLVHAALMSKAATAA